MFNKGKNNTNDISNPSNNSLEKGNDKIIIVDKDSKRKVRRRVKKGKKDEVLLERKKKREEERYRNQSTDFGNNYNNLNEVDLDDVTEDTSSSDPLGTNYQVNRVFNKKADKYQKLEDDFSIEDIDDIKLDYKSLRDKNPKSDKDNASNSHFRNRAIEWRDDEYDDFNSIDNKKPSESLYKADDEPEKSLFVSPIFWVVGLILVGIFVVCGFSVSSYAKLQATENKKASFERLVSYVATGADEIAMQVESVEAPIEFEEVVTETEEKVLSLVLSSVEKDLKIKLVNNSETLLRNVPWSVTITDEKGDEREESDDDQDGIIHLTDIKAGEYSVALIPNDALAEYEFPREKQVVSVKAKIEYKVIQDIKEEIKTEKEVNAAAEDQEGKQQADVETGPVNNDTVEWLESSQTGNGEEYVEAVPDLTKTASIKKENKFLLALNSLKNSVKANPFRNGIMAANFSIFAEIPGTEPEHEHAYDEWIPVGDGTHIRKCNICDFFDEGSCDFSKDSSKCSICGGSNPNGGGEKEKGEGHEHALSYEPFDDSEHFVFCSMPGCEKYPDIEKHSFDANGKCSKCGYKKGDSVEIGFPSDHVHDFKYKSNNDGTHTVKCKADGCDDKYDKTENCTSTTETCTKCGFTPLDHAHNYEYKSNGDGTHDATCMCGLTVKKQSCEFEGGKCKFCGYSNADYADDAQLYDASKNALYVKDGETYRLAKYADYKSGNYSTYYRRADSFLYTGWQDIDGKRYYYLSDHTYVTGDQIIGGVLYHFASDGALSQGSGTLGIDVSKYQPSINWQSVKASGVNFVIIRCGYRGSSTGVLIEDPLFKSHIKGAKAAGLKVGVYFFTTAISEAEAVEEASMCAYLCQGYGIDYPVFIDCESSSRPGYNGISASQRTEIIKAFCNTIKSAGYTPGVYANKTWLSSYMNPGSLGGARIWLAQYNSEGPTYSGHYDLWQYTSKGKVDGISGYVDMNQSYLGY